MRGLGMNEQERIIEQILWGKCIVDIGGFDNKPQSFILRSLTIKEANYAQFIYDKEYNLAITNNIMSQETLKLLLADAGIDIDNYDQQIKRIELDIQKTKAQIKHYEFFTAKKRQLEKILNKLTNEIDNLNKTKEHLLAMSAESRAEEVRRRYVVMLSTETLDEERYWPTEIDFIDERDSLLIYNLAIAYYKKNIFDMTTVRQIARSSAWRFRWAAAKNGADLFGRPISEWSEMQNLLVYWSQFYDFVFESPDRPSDIIIDDDAACDSWVEDQNKKYSNKATRSKSGRLQQEQFIMVAPKDKDAIKKVQNMNTKATRAQLQQEHQIIKEKKHISDWKLRKGRYD